MIYVGTAMRTTCKQCIALGRDYYLPWRVTNIRLMQSLDFVTSPNIQIAQDFMKPHQPKQRMALHVARNWPISLLSHDIDF